MKYKVFEKVRIEKAVAEGYCLAYAEGKTLFVSHAAPGDLADLRVIKKKKGQLYAKIEELHEAGPDRVQPKCEHAGTCGGCKWQHLDYAAQKTAKAQQVTDNFTRIGKLDFPEPLPILGGDPIFQYRNRMDFGFSHQRYLLPEEMGKEDPGPLEGLGFHVPGRFDKILDLKSCHLQDHHADTIRLFCKELAIQMNLPFYNLKTHEGLMRSLIIRNSALGEWMVILAFAQDIPEVQEYLERVHQRFPELTSLMYAINTKKNDTLYDQEILVFAGKDHLLEKLGELTFKVGPKSFFQTNTHQANVLYRVAKEFAGLSGREKVYDLYTGTGSIALYVADQAQKVVGVEYIEAAIEDARINAGMNGVEHVSFYAGDMKDVLNEEFLQREGQPDVIITDPPRAGMAKEVVEMLLRIKAPKIVYVSCNPATQARDLALMKDLYTIERVQPVDMFPHTAHVENVVLLTLQA